MSFNKKMLVVSIFGALLLTACSNNNHKSVVSKPTALVEGTVSEKPTNSGSADNALKNVVVEGTVSKEPIFSGSIDDALTNAASENISFDSKNQIVLKPAIFNGSSTGESGYDAGMNALKNGQIKNKVFSGVKGLAGSDNTVIFLRDPAAAGFKYQSFGQVFDMSGSAGYVSVGKIFTPADTATVQATYKGGAMGTYDGASEVVSDMTAKLNWGATVKTLDVEMTNSQISRNNIVQGNYVPVTKDARFDMKETLTWDSEQKIFENDIAVGNLYGDNAAEVGGTFYKEIEGKVYQGAFGGVKQP